MTAPPQPIRRVARIRLGILLRELRERARVTPARMAAELAWHQTKVSKVEKGFATVAAAELDRLLEMYDATEAERARLRELGIEARKRGASAKVANWAQTYVELERAAAEIRYYSADLIPGLLQTEGYARALLEASLTLSVEQVEEVTAGRMQRQELLRREDPPELWVVLGEAALHQEVGGRAGLRSQIEHLRNASTLQHVNLAILPFSAGAVFALGTPFALFELNDPVATFVYLAGLTDAEYLDEPPHTTGYRLTFQRLLLEATNGKDTRKLLDRRLTDLA